MTDDDLDGLGLFDGVCNFRSGVVTTALRLDRARVQRFTPLQSLSARSSPLATARPLPADGAACIVPTPEQRGRFGLKPPSQVR